MQMTLGFKYNCRFLNIQCKGNDTLNSVFDRYCIKAQIPKNDLIFVYNKQRIIGDNRTIIEHGIPDKAVFYVILVHPDQCA